MTKPKTEDDRAPGAVTIPEYASVAKTAEILDWSEATTWRRIADGTLLSVKIGGVRRVRLRESLERLSEA